MKDIKPEDIYKALNDGSSKVKSLVLANLNLLVCVLIVVALGFFKFSSMTFEVSDKPLVTITDALALYAMAVAIYFNMHWQSQKKATNDAGYIKAKLRHTHIALSLNAAGAMGGLTDFCRRYPLEELESYRRSLLEPVGLTYEQFEGTPAGIDHEAVIGYRDMSPKEIRHLSVTNRQIKAILAAVSAKARKLSPDQLIGGKTGKRSKSFLRPGKSQITIRDTATRLVRYLLVAGGLSWYTKRLTLNFTWQGVTDFIAALAVLAFAAFSGARGGTDAITEHEVNRISDQCDILEIYCERVGVKILPIPVKTEP